jgi:uncharacterized membrane protein (DUF4010 family)
MLMNGIWLNFIVVLGIGLLIGAERERNKGIGPDRSPAGIRTFTIASLLGGVSTVFNFWLLIISVLCVMVFAATAYFNRPHPDPGLTTEISLIVTVILGGLAMNNASLAAALSVCIAILLAAKDPMHGFIVKVVTKEELHNFLILAAATLIILPLVPNQFIGPFSAINPRYLWLIVILIMAISAMSHIALRWIGERIGLPIVGLISGFISSIATIGSMGTHAKETPSLCIAAAAGATFSSLATIVQLTVLTAAIYPPILRDLAWPLIFGALSITVYGVIITIQSYRLNPIGVQKNTYAFSLKSALSFAAVIAVVLVASAALKVWFGQTGLILASGVAGLADVHASAISVATLGATLKLSPDQAVMPILVALSTNTFSKAMIAIMSGNLTFSNYVVFGLVLQILSVWLGFWLF